MQAKRERKSRSSKTVQKRTGKPLSTPRSSGVPSESALTDNEKEFQDTMIIVMDLKRQLGHSLELNEALQKEMESIRTKKYEAKTLATSRGQEIKRMQEAISSLQTENERLMVALGASEEERGEAAKEINRLKDGIADGQLVGRSLEDKLLSLGNALEEAASQAQDSQERIQQLEQCMEELENHLKQRTQELHQANALIGSMNQEKQQLEAKVNYLEQSRINLGKIHDSLKGIQHEVMKRESKR